jgi:hypothetical protein
VPIIKLSKKNRPERFSTSLSSENRKYCNLGNMEYRRVKAKIFRIMIFA